MTSLSQITRLQPALTEQEQHAQFMAYAEVRRQWHAEDLQRLKDENAALRLKVAEAQVNIDPIVESNEIVAIPTRRRGVTDKIYERMNGHPIAISSLAEPLNLPVATLSDIARKMVKSGMLKRTSRGHYIRKVATALAVFVLLLTGCQSNPPSQPSPLRGTSPTATFAWDASPDASVIGYKFYQGAKSRDYTNSVTLGNVLAFMTPLPAPTNYFAGTAYDATGLESDFSNEVTRAATNSAPVLTNKVLSIWVETNSAIAGPWSKDARFNTIRLTNASGPSVFFRVGFTNFYQ